MLSGREMSKQGSDEWIEQRRGIITASRFGDVLAGKKTKRRRQYIAELRVELSGAPMFDTSMPWHEHGAATEEEGLGAYAWERDVDIVRPGFIPHQTLEYVGCSPDAFVGDDGGVELKCRSSLSSHLACLKGMPATYKPQVQGCMWVTGRLWWDFCSYYRTATAHDVIIHRVARDDDYIKKLERACKQFWSELNG